MWIFVAGVPGYLTEYFNPGIGLTNGTPIEYHSTKLGDREDAKTIKDNLTANPADEILLQYPPAYVFMRLPKANIDDLRDVTLVERDVVIPIPCKSSSTKCKVR